MTVAFVSRLGPRILGVDLAEECAALEREMGLVGENVVASGYQPFVFRALRVEGDGYAGRSVRTIEATFVSRGRRLFVARVRRDATVAPAALDTIVQRGDVIALGGRLLAAIAEQSAIGTEVDDRELLDFPVDTTDVVVTERAITRVPLGQFVEQVGHEALRGVGV